MPKCGIQIPHNLRIKYNSFDLFPLAFSLANELQAIENKRK
jgi:hypothetical protein